MTDNDIIKAGKKKMNKHQSYDLKQMQSFPLEQKIQITKEESKNGCHQLSFAEIEG